MRRLGFRLPSSTLAVASKPGSAKVAAAAGSSSASALAPLAVSQNREITGITGLLGSLAMMALTITWGGVLFQCFANMYYFGRWRFRGALEGSVIPAYDFKGWRYFGGFFGFIIYCTMVGPAKYRHSDMEKWSTRVGPF